MCGCMGSGCRACRPWRDRPRPFNPTPRPSRSEVEDLRRQLRDMEIERNALRLALRLTLEKVTK